jgi:selenocysteine-specific elongation factor
VLGRFGIVIEKHFILATAGHVDHGKSALVKALTGTDPDRLPEEKARGITIDLGFAELNLSGPNGERFHLGIVDVPGHEDFVRNMIAGVGSIDLALLVVAADDGWMPQTEEHLQILTYLGVKRAVVALTKSDIADAAKTEIEVRDKLRGTAFADAAIVPTSFVRSSLTALSSQVSQSAVAELKNALTRELSQLEPQRDIGKPRLFVDRVFVLRGIGSVATGTLSGGALSRGQMLAIQPHNLPVRIRSIQSHGRDVNSAGPGMRTALNIVGVEVGREGNGVGRGDVMTGSNFGAPSQFLDVLIERSSRIPRDSAAARPIKNRSSLYLHHGTSRVGATMRLLEKSSLAVGESGLAELRLQSPIFAFIDDRLVLRDPSERYTIGGGIVLHVEPDHVQEKSQNREWLSARATAPHDCDRYVASELARVEFAERTDLLRQSNFSADDISDAVAQLAKANQAIVTGDIVSNAERWHRLLTRAAELIDRFHQQSPQKRGANLGELRSALNLGSDSAFEALLEHLRDFVRFEDTIARRTHRPVLPVQLRGAAETITAALSTEPFDPPRRNEIAKTPDQQQALRFLIDNGDIFDIGGDVVVLNDAATQMRKIVTDFITVNGPAGASHLRQALGTSRRVVIPFLEYLDRMRVTKRVGDTRVLAK